MKQFFRVIILIIIFININNVVLSQSDTSQSMEMNIESKIDHQAIIDSISFEYSELLNQKIDSIKSSIRADTIIVYKDTCTKQTVNPGQLIANITDSLSLVYKDSCSQLVDSVYTQYQKNLLNSVKTFSDSLNYYKNKLRVTEISSISKIPENYEENFYQYTLDLMTEKKINHNLFWQLSVEGEDIIPHQVEELESYIRTFFPGKRSDLVQIYIIQIFLRYEKWADSEYGILKFHYLFPESKYSNIVNDSLAVILKKSDVIKKQDGLFERYFEKTIKNLSLETRYFEFVKLLHEFKDENVNLYFEKEAENFFAFFPGSVNAPQVCFWLAKKSVKDDKPHTAFLRYKKILQLFPESKFEKFALNESAIILAKNLEKYPESIEYFNKVISRFGTDTLATNAHFQIAEIYHNDLKDFEKAVGKYLEFSQICQDTVRSTNALFTIAKIQSDEMKLVEKSVETYKSVETRFHGSKAAQKALYMAGQLLEDNKQYTSAIDLYMTLFKNYTGTENGLKGLENIKDLYNSKIDNPEKLIETLNLIIANYPDSKNATKAKKNLKKLQKEE